MEQAADEIRQQMRVQYDEVAVGYHQLRFVRLTAARLVELAGLSPGETVLDAGTGTGHVARAAARAVGPTGQVIGVDISAGMLAHAQRTAREEGLENLTFQEGDAQDTGLPASSVDVVLSSSVLWYLPDPLAAPQHWRHLLKPTGRVIYSTYGPGNNAPFGGILDRHLARYGLRNPPAAHSLRDPEQCRALLVAAEYGSPRVLVEESGYSYASVDDYWDEVRNQNVRVELARLTADQLAAFRDELTSEVAALATPEGIWRPLHVNYCFGQHHGDPTTQYEAEQLPS